MIISDSCSCGGCGGGGVFGWKVVSGGGFHGAAGWRMAVAVSGDISCTVITKMLTIRVQTVSHSISSNCWKLFY